MQVLPLIISQNQVAFLPNRSIFDNILLAQELLCGYARSNATPSAMLKLDITKAYDSIHWSSIVRIMALMNFPKPFVGWVYECISTPSFSIVLNGRPIGYFKSMQGIRQGDLIPSYLFLLAMEVLTRYMKTKYTSSQIRYHPKCKLTNVTTLMFADDIMIFTKPHLPSIQCVISTLSYFYNMTGLLLNCSKSRISFAGITSQLSLSLLQITGLQCMVSNMTYLGLPLLTSILKLADCLPLYSKIVSLLDRWSNIYLSQAERLVLIKSIAFSMVVYWSKAFILSAKLLYLIRGAMLRFFLDWFH